MQRQDEIDTSLKMLMDSDRTGNAALETNQYVQRWEQLQREFNANLAALTKAGQKNNPDQIRLWIAEIKISLEKISYYAGNHNFQNNMRTLVEQVNSVSGRKVMTSINQLENINQKAKTDRQQRANGALQIPNKLIELNSLQAKAIEALESRDPRAIEYSQQAEKIIAEVATLMKAARQTMVLDYEQAGTDVPQRNMQFKAYFDEVEKSLQDYSEKLSIIKTQSTYDSNPNNIQSYDEAQRLLQHTISSFQLNQRYGKNIDTFAANFYKQIEKVNDYFNVHVPEKTALLSTAQGEKLFAAFLSIREAALPKAIPATPDNNPKIKSMVQKVMSKQMQFADWKGLDLGERLWVVSELRKDLKPLAAAEKNEITRQFRQLTNEVRKQETLDSLPPAPKRSR